MKTGAILNADTAGELHIENIYAGRPWPVIQYWQNDSATDLINRDDIDGDWEFVISRDENLTDVVAEYSIGNGITITDNLMEITVDWVAPLPGLFYYGLGREFLEMRGTIKINHKLKQWR